MSSDATVDPFAYDLPQDASAAAIEGLSHTAENEDTTSVLEFSDDSAEDHWALAPEHLDSLEEQRIDNAL